MKKLSKILLGAGIVASLAACDRKAEFTTSSFVAFDATSVEVAEDAGSLQIPVYAYAKNGDYAFPRSESASTSVTFEIVDGTAVNGTDFTVEPANGVLTFSGSSESGITVTPVDHDGVRTGDLSFTIRITGASDGFTLGGARELTVSIKDQDHPLANLLGQYTAVSGDGTSWTMTWMMDEEDESIVWADGMTPEIVGYGGLVYGVVSENNSVVTFSMPQFLPITSGDYYTGLVLFDGEYYYSDGELVLTYDAASGTWTSEYGLMFGAFEESENVDSFVGYFGMVAPGITLTKN